MNAPHPDQEALRRERDELAGFALAGQAVGALAHELNNLLNGMVLQASVLQMQLDKQHHEALDMIRRQAQQATALLRPLGAASAERAKGFYPVDVARVAADALRDDPGLAARVRFTPPAAACPIRGNGAAVKQFIRLLLSASSLSAPPVLMRLEADGEGVQLHIEADGGGAAPATDGALWGRLGDLERLAGPSLLRHLGGELTLAPRPEGGFSVRVCWKPTPGE